MHKYIIKFNGFYLILWHNNNNSNKSSNNTGSNNKLSFQKWNRKFLCLPFYEYFIVVHCRLHVAWCTLPVATVGYARAATGATCERSSCNSYGNGNGNNNSSNPATWMWRSISAPIERQTICHFLLVQLAWRVQSVGCRVPPAMINALNYDEDLCLTLSQCGR